MRIAILTFSQFLDGLERFIKQVVNVTNCNDRELLDKQLASATNELRENIATMAIERDKLEAALRGLLARHNDGSDEQHWAEWDTARAALAQAKEPGCSTP